MKKIFFCSLKIVKGLVFLLCATPFYLFFFMIVISSKEEVSET